MRAHARPWPGPGASDRPAVRRLLPGMALAALLLALGLLYAPVVRVLAQRYWPVPSLSHGPLVLATLLALFAAATWQHARQAHADRPRRAAGALLLALGLLMLLAGSGLQLAQLAVLSLAPVLAGLGLLLSGPALLRRQGFGFFFLLFLVPWPEWMTDVVTQPLKLGVSAVVEAVLHHAGYPVARQGVMLDVGPYRLQVADACAGMNALFMLEAFGLLYLHLLRHTSALRNAVLALLIVPVSFTANCVRVLVLALLTYHGGDALAQGFMHEFSGLVLFAAALALLAPLDALLRRAARPS
ncbi:MAG: exosortase [Roseateles sp.]|uniref:exosortase n=1 Tax=Roseateles sp. TaxID=1971397 RepID=UPI0039EA59E5